MLISEIALRFLFENMNEMFYFLSGIDFGKKLMKSLTKITKIQNHIFSTLHDCELN